VVGETRGAKGAFVAPEGLRATMGPDPWLGEPNARKGRQEPVLAAGTSRPATKAPPRLLGNVGAWAAGFLQAPGGPPIDVLRVRPGTLADLAELRFGPASDPRWARRPWEFRGSGGGRYGTDQPQAGQGRTCWRVAETTGPPPAVGRKLVIAGRSESGAGRKLVAPGGRRAGTNETSGQRPRHLDPGPHRTWPNRPRKKAEPGWVIPEGPREWARGWQLALVCGNGRGCPCV